MAEACGAVVFQWVRSRVVCTEVVWVVTGLLCTADMLQEQGENDWPVPLCCSRCGMMMKSNGWWQSLWS